MIKSFDFFFDFISPYSYLAHKKIRIIEKKHKIRKLMKSIDYTNHKYGRSTLSLADAGLNKKWNLRRKYSSKIDTADFHYLPTIRAI